MTAAGGVKPYKWSVSTGAVPSGLTLANDGTLSGSPTAAGTFTFTIQTSDSGDSTASIPGVIKVAPHLTASLLPACAQYCNVELGCADACGAFGTYGGGIGPYNFTVKQGPLPAGTSLSPNSLTLNGTFGGQSGYLQFTVQVGDAFGATATVSPTFWMYQHISLAGGTCTGRGKCAMILSYNGGTPNQMVKVAPIAWTGANCGAVAPYPCPEPTFNVTYQPGNAVIALTYQPNYPATFGTMKLQITSSDFCGPATSCTGTATIQVVG
jgi:hypothetical protein